MNEHKWLIIKITAIFMLMIFAIIFAVDGCSHRNQDKQEYSRAIYVTLEKQNELIERQNSLLKNLYELSRKIQDCNCNRGQ